MFESLFIYAFAAGCALFVGKGFHDSYKKDPEGTMKKISDYAEKAQARKEKAGKAGDNK